MPQAVDDDYVYGICTFTEMRMRMRGMNIQLKKQYYTVFITLGAKPCHVGLYYFTLKMFCFILEVFTKYTKTCIIHKINTP